VRNAYLILAGKGKRPLGKPRSRWEDNIEMDLKEVGYQTVNWIHPAQNRVH
jgi:hypothetical protein